MEFLLRDQRSECLAAHGPAEKDKAAGESRGESQNSPLPRRRRRFALRVNLRLFLLLWLMTSFLAAWWGLRRQIHAVEVRLKHTEAYVALNESAGIKVDAHGVVCAVYGNAADLYHLPNYEHVVEVNIFHCEADQLAVLDRFPLLKTVRFASFHGVAAEAAARLTDQLHLTRLRARHVSDEDAAPLAQLRQLEYLHLEDSPLTDASIQSLSQLTGLEILSIHGSHITPAGAARLGAALPGCRLVLSSVQ